MAQFSEIQADTSNLPCWLLSSHCFAVTTLSVPLPSVGAVSVKHGPNHCVTVKVSISAVGLWLSADFNYHASAMSMSETDRKLQCYELWTGKTEKGQKICPWIGIWRIQSKQKCIQKSISDRPESIVLQLHLEEGLWMGLCQTFCLQRRRIMSCYYFVPALFPKVKKRLVLVGIEHRPTYIGCTQYS